MLTRYQDRAVGSHGFGTPDRTRLRGIRTGLQDLTGSKHQIERPMRCQNGVALCPGLGTQDRTCLQGIRTGLQDFMGSANQIVHACLRGIRTGLQDLTGLEQQI